MSKNNKKEDKKKNLVYVINYDGSELPPTSRRGKVRKLLDSGQAVVVKKQPFTIKLKYDCYNDFQKEEKKQLELSDITPMVDVDENINIKEDINMSRNLNTLEKLNNEVEKELQKTENIWMSSNPYMKAPRNTARYPERSLKELMEAVKGDGTCKQYSNIGYSPADSLEDRCEKILSLLPKAKSDESQMVREKLVKELYPIFEEHSEYMQLLSEASDTFIDLTNDWNNNIQLAVYALTKALTLSFKDKNVAIEKFAYVLNNMKMREEINNTNDFVPYVAAILNINAPGYSEKRAFEIVKYPNCDRLKQNNEYSGLNKYGKIDASFRALFEYTMDWVTYASREEDGLIKSIQATYCFMISFIKQCNTKIITKTPLSLIAFSNQLYAERKDNDYWKMIVEMNQNHSCPGCIKYYQKYLESCNCQRAIELSYDVKKQIETCVRERYEINDERYVERCFHEITLYRAAKNIPLDNDFDVSQGLPEIVLQYVPRTIFGNNNKEDEFFF